MFKDLLNEIKENKTIVLFRHANPDADAAGSTFGLKEIIKENFKDKDVYVASLETNELIEKLFPTGDEVSEEIINKSLNIICDTANVERIDGKPNLDNSIKVDHHPNNEPFGKFLVGGTKYSSTCEVVTKFAIENDLTINKQAAEYLFAGLVTDTGRFMYSSTTPETFEAAKVLLSTGYKPQDFYNKLYNRDFNFVRFSSYVQSKMKLEGNVTSFVLPKGKEKKFNVAYPAASSAVYLLMGTTEGQYGMYATFDAESGLYRVSLRSKKKPVNTICELFGGGGHAQACGIKVEKKQLKQILEELQKL